MAWRQLAKYLFVGIIVSIVFLNSSIAYDSMNLGNKVIDGALEGQRIVGTAMVDRGWPSPIVNTKVWVEFFTPRGNRVGVVEDLSITDERGNFSFPYPFNVNAGYQYKIVLDLTYIEDGTNYFVLKDRRRKHHSVLIEQSGRQAVWSEADLNVELYPEDGAFYKEDRTDSKELKNVLLYYEEIIKGLKFYRQRLNVELDYNLPINIELNCEGEDSSYNYDWGRILIAERHSSLEHPHAKEVFYHELAHVVLFDLWQGKEPRDKGDLNHGGYANKTTADSYIEGFAHFMTTFMKKEYGIDRPNIYREYGDLEINLKAWEKDGLAEEFAVAGVLYDLLDEASGDDDEVQISFGFLWPIMTQYHQDFTSVYESLKESIGKDPEFNKEVDQIFIDHGFFVDDTPGDFVRSLGEAYIDRTKDSKFTTYIESHVDYSTQGPYGIMMQEYQVGDKIGSAGHSQNIQRRSSVYFPGHFIKVEGEAAYFRINVEFPEDHSKDYSMVAENVKGRVFVGIPPFSYDAKIAIEPVGREGVKPLEFSSKEFAERYNWTVQQGYYEVYEIPPLPIDKVPYQYMFFGSSLAALFFTGLMLFIRSRTHYLYGFESSNFTQILVGERRRGMHLLRHH